MPLAHTEGGLSDSLLPRREGRGGVGRLPNVRAPGQNHPSILLRLQVDAGEALALARWIEGEVEAMREWIAELETTRPSRATRSCAR